MMARAKRIFILIIKVNKVFLFSLRYFLKEIENMLSLVTETLLEVWENLNCESLGELELGES